MTKAERIAARDYQQATTLWHALNAVDVEVFNYSVELKSAGDLRFWIRRATDELRKHMDTYTAARPSKADAPLRHRRA